MSDQAKIISVLQQLVQAVGGSLPMYLASAVPWTERGHEKGAELLELLVQDQTRTITRASDHITELGGVVEQSFFPASYTSLNDVSLDYLLQRLGSEQTDLVPKLEMLAARLPLGTTARDLIEEAAGSARGHAQSIEELAGELSA